MAHKISRRFFALCLGFMVLTVSAHGQDYKPLLGKWNMTSESTENPVKWTLTLQESEGKLTGSLSVGEGEQPAKDLTFRWWRFEIPGALPGLLLRHRAQRHGGQAGRHVGWWR